MILDDITKLDMPSPKVWVQKVLTETDKDIITFGNKLSDQHINFAQSTMKNFDQLSGLYWYLISFSHEHTSIVWKDFADSSHRWGSLGVGIQH